MNSCDVIFSVCPVSSRSTDFPNSWLMANSRFALRALSNSTEQFQFSVANDDLLFLNSGWYVTIQGSRAWHVGIGALVSRCSRFSRFATLRHNAGHSKPRSSNCDCLDIVWQKR